MQAASTGSHPPFAVALLLHQPPLIAACPGPSLAAADLESLFIDSDEVRKELPEATQRFIKIDAAVRAVLQVGWWTLAPAYPACWHCDWPRSSQWQLTGLPSSNTHLQEFLATKNCVRACNKEGLLKVLETQQAELEMCEKVRAGGEASGCCFGPWPES